MRKLLFIAIIILSSCKKDKPEPELDSESSAFTDNRVLVCNEGNFNWGNSTLTLYDKTSQTAIDSVFYKSNAYALGDVCQSAIFNDNQIYLVINNSAKIEVLNPDNFKVQATIEGFNSPRYITPISEKKAYVTDLYANKIWILDLENNKISGAIKCKGWTEELVYRNGVCYVTNMTSKYLYLVNTENDLIQDSIQVGKDVGSIRKDKFENIWCLRSSDTTELIKIDNNNEAEHFLLAESSGGQKLRYSDINHKLYYLSADVMEFDINNQSTRVFYHNEGSVYNGLGIDGNGDVYIADAKDYVQASEVIICDDQGDLKNSFSAGIISGYFLFR